MIDMFYAVTATSLYCVKSDNGHGYPAAEKMAVDADSRIPVGRSLCGGPRVAIGRSLVFFYPKSSRESRYEDAPQHSHVQSSPLVGLFLDAARAGECFRAEDRAPADQRWRKDTEAVADAIGQDHPVFEICRTKNSVFPAQR